MNFKTTYILFGVLGGLFVLVFLAVWLSPPTRGETDFVLPSLHERNAVQPNDIDRVEIERTRPRAEALVFKRDAGSKSWKMAKPARLRVNSQVVDQLIRQVFDARRYQLADLTPDLKEWDLDPPLGVVTIKKGVDQEWTLNLGRERAGGESSGVVYVTSSDRPKEPMAVKRSELETLFKNLSDFRSRDLLTESLLNIVSVKLQKEKEPAIALEKSGDHRWRFKEPAWGEADYDVEAPGAPASPHQPTETGGVHGLLEAIEKIKVESDEDFVEDNPGDLTRYGLEGGKPVFLRIEVTQRVGNLFGGEDKKEPVTDALLIGNKVDVKDKDKKAGESDKYFARLESETAVVRISAKSLEPILKAVKEPASFRNRDLVQVDQLEAKTDAVDIQGAGGLIKLRKPEGTWKIFTGGKGRNADDQSIQGQQGLLPALKGKGQVEFADTVKEADMGLDKPEAVVSIWTDSIDRKKEKPEEDSGEKKEEKKEESKDPNQEPKLTKPTPTVKLTFGKKDKLSGKDVVFVRREEAGGKNLLAMPVSILEKVAQKPLAYFDRTLPAFSESAEVTRLTIERGGQAYEVEKDDKTARWTVKQPKELAGRAADRLHVENVIRELRELHPERLETEKASDSDLDKFGLKTPRIKATVSVKDKDKKTQDWTYLFGKEEKNDLFARQGDRDLVFLLPSRVLKPLQADLLDLTVFHFDPSKVKEIKLTGWKKVYNSTFVLDLERKGPGSWAAKVPKDFDQDNEQVEGFLDGLAGLKADKVVVRQAGPAPTHELDEKERTLLIEITVEGEKAPLTLTFGKLDDKEKVYFAQSSTMPGDVFLLPQARFEKLLGQGAKYFSKAADVSK